MNPQWEKKNDERNVKIEKEIDKIAKDRDRNEKDKDQREKDGKMIDWKDVYVAQRSRLRDLFSEIDKEFQILWEENQDLRRKLDDAYNRPSSGTFSVPRKSASHEVSSMKDNVKDMLNFGSRLTSFKKEPEYEILTHFVGHRDGIWEVSTCTWEPYSFATASADRTARVWSSNASNPVYIYVGHKGSVNSARFHPSNRLVCTASGDQTVHVWKLPKPEEKEKKDKPEKQEVKGKSWAPLLDKETPPNQQTNSTNPNPNLEIRPSSSPGDQNPNLQSVESPEQPQNENAIGIVTVSRSVIEVKHKGVVIAADWFSTGDKLVSASWDNTVKVWSLENGKILHDLETGHDATHVVKNIDTHSSQPLFLTASSDYRFRIWDIRSSQPVASAVQAHSEAVTSVCFVNADDNLIVSGSDDKTVKVWDKRNMKLPRNTIRCSEGVNKFAVSPVASNLIVPLDDIRTKVCDLNGKLIGRLKSEGKYGHKLMVTGAAWSSDESVVFTAGFDRTVIAWALRPPSSKHLLPYSTM